MSKIEINNEIVLMRHVVRRARLHVVRKLIKQIKMLGVKKGDDKQREKYKRKGEKLGKELMAIKKIHDDEVSRFSITNNKKLEDILNDPKSDIALRALARLANYKIVRDRTEEFKKKFPNYEEHLGPGRRKLIKLKRKAGKQAKKDSKLIVASSEAGDDTENSMNSLNEEETLETTEEKNCESELKEKVTDVKRKVENSLGENKKRVKIKNTEPKLKKSKEELNKPSRILTTNKESTVKSFSRFLEEENEEEDTAAAREILTNDNKIVLEKEVDSFFMTEDGAGEYLSVVVPKLDLPEDEEGEKTEFEDRSSSRSRNNKYFDKIDRVERPRNVNGYNSNNNNSFVKGDKFRERNQKRDNIGGRYNKPIDAGTEDKRKSLNESMHPSWAAKKKEQEILKLGFQGKKIVFDD